MAADPLTPATASAVWIGLTGGIGSGKSTVARCLAQRGATLIDTDAIARSLTAADGAAIAPIRQLFGSDYITPQGELDRAKMRRLAFSDAAAKQRLEALLHPLITQEAARQANAAQTAPAIVFDVPLLVESSHWRARVHKVLVVDCEESTQVERVVARSGWTPDAVQAVIQQQASRTARRAAADAVIFNDGITLDQLSADVGFLWDQWVQHRAV